MVAFFVSIVILVLSESFCSDRSEIGLSEGTEENHSDFGCRRNSRTGSRMVLVGVRFHNDRTVAGLFRYLQHPLFSTWQVFSAA